MSENENYQDQFHTHDASSNLIKKASSRIIENMRMMNGPIKPNKIASLLHVASPESKKRSKIKSKKSWYKKQVVRHSIDRSNSKKSSNS